MRRYYIICCLSGSALFYRPVMEIKIFDRFSRNIQIQNLRRIRPLGAEWFHADGHTDR